MSQTINQVTPEGYKQTEVGVIPEDWEVKKLKEISPSQSVGLVINPSSYYSNSGTIPMLVGSHVFENKIKWSKANKITAESNLRLPASRLKTGDLVTVRVGEPGITAVVPPELNQSNCASMMIIRQGPKFDSHWLCFLMNSKIGKSRIEGVQYGTAQKQFNIIDAVDFLFPFPTKEEQTAIANALSDVDALLSELEKLIAKKQAMKTATMQQLLTGKTRLPQFAYYSDINCTEGAVGGMRNHSSRTNVNVGACNDGSLASQESVGMNSRRKGTKPSELGEIPEDWDVVELGRITQKQRPISYGIVQTGPRVNDGVRCLRVVDISNGLISKDDLITTTVEISNSYKRTQLQLNDLVIPLRGKVGEVGIIDVDLVGDNLTRGVALIALKNGFSAKFLKQIISFENSAKRLESSMNGSALQEVSIATLRSFKVAIPLEEEQTVIATILSDMDTEIQTLEQRLSKTRQIKQGMMQELLTGKTRLPFDKIADKE